MPKFTIEVDSLEHLLILAPLVDILEMFRDEDACDYYRITQTLTAAGDSMSSLILYAKILGERISSLEDVSKDMWSDSADQLQLLLDLLEKKGSECRAR
jgi:hypothetical protein